jgi:hypothetical protein
MKLRRLAAGRGSPLPLVLVNGVLRVARGSVENYLLVQPIGPFDCGTVRFCLTVPLMPFGPQVETTQREQFTTDEMSVWNRYFARSRGTELFQKANLGYPPFLCRAQSQQSAGAGD